MQDSKQLDLKELYEKAPSPENILSKIDISGLAALGGAEEMRKKIEQYEEARAVIVNYIDRNFVKDVDFGPTDERSPKPTLKKPGAEKVCRLFNTRPVWTVDKETWEMLGSPENTICMLCRIIDNKTGAVIGEGRGAERVGNKARDANKTIKNAEKCSLVDAALYTFMLSEKFTQDDGGVNKSDLANGKNLLMADVQHERAGITSELSDHAFVISVINSELHKKHIDTLGELAMIRKVLFEKQLYDWGTGAKKKTSKN